LWATLYIAVTQIYFKNTSNTSIVTGTKVHVDMITRKTMEAGYLNIMENGNQL